MQVKQIATKFSAFLLTVLMVISCMIPVTVSAEGLTENEAKVGDTEYATLKEAVVAANAATTDATITLLRDIELKEQILIKNSGKTITVEGDGNTIYIANDDTVRALSSIFELESCNITFKNVNFNGQPKNHIGEPLMCNTGATTNRAPFRFYGPAYKLTFDGCSITGFHVAAGYSVLYMRAVQSVASTYTGTYGLCLKDTVITGNSTADGNNAIKVQNGTNGTDVTVMGKTIVKDNLKKDNAQGNLENYQNGKTLNDSPRLLVKDSFTGEVHLNNTYKTNDGAYLVKFEGDTCGYLGRDFFNGIVAQDGKGYLYRKLSDNGSGALYEIGTGYQAYYTGANGNDAEVKLGNFNSWWITNNGTENGMVGLLKDLDVDATITVSKPMSVYGHGHTIKQTSTNAGNLFGISATGEVDVYDLTFHGGATKPGEWETPLFATGKRMVEPGTACDVIFTDCTFTGMRVNQTGEATSPVVLLGGRKVTFAGHTVITDNITRGVDASGNFVAANGGAVLRHNNTTASVSFEGLVEIYGNYRVSNDTTGALEAYNYYAGNAQRTYVSGELLEGSKIMTNDSISVVVGKDTDGVPFGGAEDAFYDPNGNKRIFRLERTTADDGSAYTAFGNKEGVLYQTQGADWTDDQYAIVEKAMYASLTKDNMTVNIIAKSYASPVDTLVKIYVGGEARAEYRLYELASTTYKNNVCSIIPVMVNMNEMTKPITVEVGDTSGDGFRLLEALEPVDPITVKYYADVILNDTTGAYDAVKDSVKALLNLGGYSEGYFNKKPVAERVNAGIWEEGQNPVDNLATNPLRADAVNVVTAGTLPEGVTVYGAALYLSGEISMRLRIDGTIAEGTELKVGYGNALVDCEIVTGSDGHSYIEMAHIGTAKLGDMITFKVGDYTYQCSPMTYVNAVLKGSQDTGLVELCKALYLYYDTVATEFGFTNTVK